jgi:hypothetical protein
LYNSLVPLHSGSQPDSFPDKVQTDAATLQISAPEMLTGGMKKRATTAQTTFEVKFLVPKVASIF